MYPEMNGWLNKDKSIMIIYHTKRLKDRKHIIFSLDAGKISEKESQYHLIIK